MNNSSNDVKILLAQMISHLARSQSTLLPVEILKPVVPTLINGTMEKNSMVRRDINSVQNNNIPQSIVN